MLQVHGGSKESSGLGDLYDSRVHHLSAAHCAFLQQWDRLIDLEAKETQVRSFYTFSLGRETLKFSAWQMTFFFYLYICAACKK